MPIGPAFPFSLSTGSLGYFEVTEDQLAAIASNVRALLATNWGERPMHHELGANLREFVFEPRVSALRSRISDRIKSQLAKWMPFLVLDKLFVSFSDDDVSVGVDGFKISMEILFGNRVVLVSQTVSP